MLPAITAAPDQLNPEQRAREIATILANSILRTYSENNDTERPVRLGFSASKSVHATPLNVGEKP